MAADSLTLEYKGACFGVRVGPQRQFGIMVARIYQISGIVSADVEDLYLPDNYEGYALGEAYTLNGVDKKVFSKVKRIYIPTKVRRLSATNDMFPNLERIIVNPSNKKLRAVGPMLLIDGELSYVFSAGQKENCHLPAEIKVIGKNAFDFTKCRSITCDNPEIEVGPDAFVNDCMITKNSDMVVVGNTLVYYCGENRDIIIPDYITRICSHAFDSVRIAKSITLPRLFPGINQGNLPQCIQSISLTKQTEHIHWDVLREFMELKSINIQGSSLYQTIDGVVFSHDKKTLIFYPPCLKFSYSIPEGTETIAPFAFMDNRTLTHVTLPDSVCNIGIGAFYYCRRLESVRLPDKLKMLQGASGFASYGIFENCGRLSKVELPATLRIIGAYAFANTAITSIEIPEGVEMIEEYAFASYDGEQPLLESCSLPSTLSRIGGGAIAGAKIVSVFEGTAKGLISAIEAKLPDRKNDKNRLIWNAATLNVQCKSGQGYVIYIPMDVPDQTRCTLECAWNQPEFDFERYCECFDNVISSEEKQQIALNMVACDRGDKTIYSSYLYRVASELYPRLIEKRREQDLIHLIQCNVLSVAVLHKILDLVRKCELPAAAAYILGVIQHADKKTDYFPANRS